MTTPTEAAAAAAAYALLVSALLYRSVSWADIYRSLDRSARITISIGMLIAGALVFKWVDVSSEGGIPDGFVAPFVWGIVASGITGWLAVWGTLKIVKTHSFTPFVVYRITVGVGVLVLYAIR